MSECTFQCPDSGLLVSVEYDEEEGKFSVFGEREQWGQVQSDAKHATWSWIDATQAALNALHDLHAPKREIIDAGIKVLRKRGCNGGEIYDLCY